MEVAGSSILKVDAKGRIFLPKRYLEFQDEDDNSVKRVTTSFWLSPGLEGCLWLLDQPEWRRLQRRLKVSEIGDQRLRLVQRFVFEHSEKLRPDAQGRILLPETHRSLAQIEDRAQVLGMGRRIEIWSPSVYGSYRTEAERNWQQLLEAVLSGEEGQK